MHARWKQSTSLGNGSGCGSIKLFLARKPIWASSSLTHSMVLLWPSFAFISSLFWWFLLYVCFNVLEFTLWSYSLGLFVCWPCIVPPTTSLVGSPPLLGNCWLFPSIVVLVTLSILPTSAPRGPPSNFKISCLPSLSPLPLGPFWPLIYMGASLGEKYHTTWVDIGGYLLREKWHNILGDI